MQTSLLHPTLSLQTLETEMICIEGGEFEMGVESSLYDAEPMHPVKLEGFELCRCPVSQKLWQEVTGGNFAYFRHSDRPMELVSWYDAVVFCNQLSELHGLNPSYKVAQNQQDSNNKNVLDPLKWTVQLHSGANGYRLPTEAEWEYAARGGKYGKDHAYAGSAELEEVGWYRRENSFGETQAVGLKLPNALGLFDMSGNVWEWCQDWYDEVYYQKCADKAIIQDPKGPKSGEASWRRVRRGGSWRSGAGDARVSYRDFWTPGNMLYSISFRLARSI